MKFFYSLLRLFNDNTQRKDTEDTWWYPKWFNGVNLPSTVTDWPCIWQTKKSGHSLRIHNKKYI